MKPASSFLFLLIVLFLAAFALPASAAPLALDLGQGLAYHRAAALPGDLPAASAKKPQPLILDLRYATGDADAATALAAWLKFRLSPQAPVFLLANAATAPALRAAFADRDHAAGLIVLGVAADDFIPDIALAAEPAAERRAYEALTDAASAAALINPPLAKPRNDEASLTAQRTAERSAERASVDAADPAAVAPAPPTPATTAPAPAPSLVDPVLQRAVQLHRALLALRKL
jgi:hypothetical protein